MIAEMHRREQHALGGLEPGGVFPDFDDLATLNREHGANFGLWSSVVIPGTIKVGDEVTV